MNDIYANRYHDIFAYIRILSYVLLTGDTNTRNTMNWSPNVSKPLELLIETERVADQILQNKQEIVELDKRRQSSREAKRNLEKTSDKKAWVTVGPILVKMAKENGIKLLEKGTNDLMHFVINLFL